MFKSAMRAIHYLGFEMFQDNEVIPYCPPLSAGLTVVMGQDFNRRL